MFDQDIQFYYFVEPPISFLDIFNQPLISSDSKLDYFKIKYSKQSNRFNQLKIFTQQNLITDSLMINLNIESPNIKVQQKFDYNHNNLKIHSQIITQAATSKSTRSISPLRNVYLSSSLVARRQLYDYVKQSKSPDPYELYQSKTLSGKNKKTDFSSLLSKTTHHLLNYGI